MTPAPIDVGMIKQVVAPFGQSRTLPEEAYRSNAVFAWELEHFFEQSWTCLGRVPELAGPGQVRGVDLAGRGLLVSTSAGSGEVRVFRNVCRHRGHELVPEGEALDLRLIRCPYHSWSYRLDGSLRSAPTFTQGDEFDSSAWPLLEIRSETWRGWLFVDLSGQAPPLRHQLGNIEEVLAPYQPERLVWAAGHEYRAAANWKLIVENYHECYHCSTIHPALCRVSPPDSGFDIQPTGLWAGGTMDLVDEAETMSLDGRSGGVMLPGLDDDRRRQVLYLAVWPNLLISAHPDYLMTHTLMPLAPNQTRIVCDWYFDPAAVTDPSFSPSFAVDFWDLTNREDFTACEGVQRGMENGGYRQGPLSPWESTVYQFLTMVGDGYLGKEIRVPEVVADHARR